MRFALVLLVFSLSALDGQAVAPSWHFTVQTYSFHESTSDANLHNTTPGLGLIRRRQDWLTGVGIFRNSIGRWAGYGYVGWQPAVWPTNSGPVRLGAIGGITHHYLWNDGGIVPLGAAVLTIPLTNTTSLDLVGIPRIKNATYATLNVSFSWQFK